MDEEVKEKIPMAAAYRQGITDATNYDACEPPTNKAKRARS